ncbi:MAG: ankyrin repeat domain-containing protein [Thermodesulfobacteriota bacterium]|nr:ankyrin repeat domain-containing protein [Thermodesulfobacteriota bacterium]
MRFYIVNSNSFQLSFRHELGKSPLMYASGAWFRYTNIDGRNEKHIGDGRPQLVKFLLYHGANIDTRDKIGRTSLMHASEIRNVEIMRILLESGADIDARDKRGKTVLSALNPDWKRNLKEVTMLLEKYGAKE